MTKSFVLIYGDAQLPYQVQEDPARSTRIAIHVEPDGTVIVDAPPGFTDEAVQYAVQKRARWIACQSVTASSGTMAGFVIGSTGPAAPAPTAHAPAGSR